MKKIQPKSFDVYVKQVKERLSRLEEFSLPPALTWKVDWKEVDKITAFTERTRWQRHFFYKTLLEQRHSPAVYYFEIDAKDSNAIHQLFLKSRKIASDIKIRQGVAMAGYRNISFVSNDFEVSDCLYVGSRKQNVHRRLLQHLGFGSARTGGLNLFSVLAKERTKFSITFYCHFLKAEYGIVTEDIEAVVQSQLNPIVGKRILGD